MEIIIAIIGTASAVITVTLTNFFVKKNQLKLNERKLKEEYYISFIKSLSNVVVTGNSIESISFLAENQNQLLLLANTDVINKIMNFQNYITNSGGHISQKHHDILLKELIMAMRMDLFQNKKINKNFPDIHLSGK